MTQPVRLRPLAVHNIPIQADAQYVQQWPSAMSQWKGSQLQTAQSLA